MKIKSVRIVNFRALRDISIEFDSVTSLIGPNGSGKSTVLRALDWFFNSKPSALADNDRCFGSSSERIEVQVTFSTLTPADRIALGKYAPPEAVTFTAWKTREADGTEVLSANAKSYPPFNVIRSKVTGTEKKTAYQALRASDASLGLAAWTNIEAANQAMTAWEANHTELLIDAPESLQTNFFGFNGNGKMSGLFDFVLVTADLRASEESVDGRSSIIGRILERSVDRTAADAEIAEIVADSRAKQQAVYEDKFRSQLNVMTAQLNEVVATYSPGRSILVSPATIELRAPRTVFDVAVRDGESETPVERQGHGFQRTLLIAALQLLAQSGAASSDGIICLAIEEPELFQHPIQAYAFAKVLRSLAEDPAKRLQVTYATHSPCFVEAQHFDQVRRLTRQSTPPTVSVDQATVAEVKAKLAGYVQPEVVDRQLDGIIATQLATAFFAHRVLLVEGTTESAVFHGIGDRSAPGSIEAAGISIVPVGGKNSIPLAHAILSCIGIPVYVVFDADSGFEARAISNGKAPEKIESERTNHASTNRLLLRYFGLPQVDFPPQTASNSVAIFEDHLEAFLEQHWGQWVDACNELEAIAQVSLKKNQLAYRTATLKASGTVPEALEAVLAKTRGI